MEIAKTMEIEIPGYTILRKLGAGGMATVYLAIQEKLKRQVALKILEPTLAIDSNFTERFLKEGRIIDQLRHLGIVPLFEFNIFSHYYYYSMEFLPGGTLSQKIQQGLTPEHALTITKLIAEALAYAHRHGVIHRDLKPRNILFRQDGTPVLSDFGIAKVIDADATNLTALGTVIGSLPYMSPEQAASKPLDARSDLYSLGVVLYEMLTKQLPHQARDLISLLLMHGSGTIPVLPVEVGKIQPVLNKLLAQNPDDRFKSAEQLIHGIDQIENNQFFEKPNDNIVQTTSSAKPEFPTQPAKLIRERPARATRGLWLAITVAIAVGAYLAVFSPSPQQDQHDVVRNQTSQPQQQIESFLAQARARQQQGALDDSLDLITQGLRLAPEQPDLLALRDQVKTELDHRKHIADLLHDCAVRFPLNRLTDNQGEAAVACYDQILNLDSTNIEARVHLEQIINQFADWINAALLQGDLNKAENYLARLNRFRPDHPRLSILGQNLQAKRDQATAEAAQRQAKETAQRQAIEEEIRRKAIEEETRRRAVEEELRQGTEKAAKRKPAEPSRSETVITEAKRKPSMVETGTNKHRRCGDILSRTSLGEPVSNEDRAFIMKECR